MGDYDFYTYLSKFLLTITGRVKVEQENNYDQKRGKLRKEILFSYFTVVTQRTDKKKKIEKESLFDAHNFRGLTAKMASSTALCPR